MTGKDFLSQEEIDALLKQGGGGGEPEAESSYSLSDFESDALGEIGNISFGTAATALSTLLRQKVEITTPTVTIVKREELQHDLPIPHVVVKVDYSEGFIGANVLAMRMEDAQIIADLMLGGEGKVTPGELNELHLSAVAEAMNQMMGSASTSMSTIFNMLVNITPPQVEVMEFDEQRAAALFPGDESLVKISFRLTVGDLIDSQIMNLVPFAFAKTMLSKLTGKTETEDTVGQPAPEMAPSQSVPTSNIPQPTAQEPIAASPVQQPSAPMQQPMMTPPMQQPGVPYQSPMAGGAMPMPNAYPSAPVYGMPPGGYMSPPAINVQPAQFSSFGAADPNVMGHGNLGLLLDIPLQVTVELGRTRKQIREILELGPGSILELDKLAGEPVDILVNNKLVAKGEVVVIDENFGVRVTDIITPEERITKLQ
ncbi:flagellar motor switch phosphatase FliY [Effusibacillus dendaii]|uniref:Flagellar motor switch phosphatase FliY n=1 Tax=Effusibacillus dendaii TaxID=2743772 RepID=A0A7I8DBG7_9BACL|nr:flagellar motor switch phosphatase FliY [Effusibacillus dendaii]BCJ85271.1 flagellar motor switch phosphatase FliY [Effusibacillus dendaii]